MKPLLNRTHSLVRRSRLGYTLIELIVSITILMIILLALVHSFDRGATAWENGTRMAEQNLVGRAVMDYISLELSQSVASPDMPITIGGNTIEFHSLNGRNQDQGYFRTRRIRYSVDSDGVLVREETAISTDQGSQPDAVTTNKLCDGVTTLSFDATSSGGSSLLPSYVDIYLEVRASVDDVRNTPEKDRSYSTRTHLVNTDRYLYGQ